MRGESDRHFDRVAAESLGRDCIVCRRPARDRPGPTYDIDSVPEARNRERMGEWIDTAGLAALLDTLERRAWRDPQIICPPTYWRLAAPDVARVKRQAVRLIEAAGGRVDLGSVVVTVAAGELRTSLP